MSGRPLPSLSWVTTVQSWKSAAAPAASEEAAADADAGGVLRLEGNEVALVEIGEAALGAEIEPVLRDQEAGLPPSAALSMALDQVYCTSEVKPLRRRRRNWRLPAWRVELPFDVR